MNLFDDTRPKATRVYLRLLSQAPAWKKIEMLDLLYATGVSLARAGVRRRYPDADESEIRWRVARLFLGKQLADKVYGPSLEGNQIGEGR